MRQLWLLLLFLFLFFFPLSLLAQPPIIAHSQAQCPLITGGSCTNSGSSTQTETTPTFSTVGATFWFINAWSFDATGSGICGTVVTSPVNSGMVCKSTTEGYVCNQLCYIISPSTSSSSTVTCTGQYGGCLTQVYNSIAATFDNYVGDTTHSCFSGNLALAGTNELLISSGTGIFNATVGFGLAGSYDSLSIYDQLPYNPGATEAGGIAIAVDASSSTVDPGWTDNGNTFSRCVVNAISFSCAGGNCNGSTTATQIGTFIAGP